MQDNLKGDLMSTPAKRDEFASLQRRLKRRSDLTGETLSKCHKTQLEVLVAIKTGIVNYVSGRCPIPSNELVEIFLQLRCPNMSCKSFVPVDDCDCKICSGKKGLGHLPEGGLAGKGRRLPLSIFF